MHLTLFFKIKKWINSVQFHCIKTLTECISVQRSDDLEACPGICEHWKSLEAVANICNEA